MNDIAEEAVKRLKNSDSIGVLNKALSDPLVLSMQDKFIFFICG